MSSIAAAGLDVRALDGLLADPAVSEIMINAGMVWVERRGQLHRTSLFLGPDQVAGLIDRTVGQGGVRVDRASPLADLRLRDGSRVNIVVPPAAPDGPLVTIRRFTAAEVPVEAFGPPDIGAVLVAAVARRRNIGVSGATGSGKTTLLNALSRHIDPGERVVTIEETAELRLAHPHVVRLEAQRPNADGAGGVTVRQLVVNALRMRPDRIIVGEVRAAEVLDMAQAMNTGHAGSLSTCHANSPRDALRRLEAMAMLGDEGWPLPFVRGQLRGSVDLVVQVARSHDGRRSVQQIVEVDPDVDWTTGQGLRNLAGGSDAP